MNKKGDFGFGYLITFFVMIAVIIVLVQAQRGTDTSTIDKTINTFNWSNFNGNISSSFDRVASNSPYWIGEIMQICKKGIDFIGYSMFTIVRLAMNIAKDNPNIMNWRVLFYLVILSFLMPIIYYAFLASMVIFLLIREWVLNRRERKKLEGLERQGR